MLVEREEELSLLNSMLAKAQNNEGSIVAICGPPSSGKTALLHAFSQYAMQVEAICLQATASQSERVLPFGVIEQLISSHPDREEIAAALSAAKIQSSRHDTDQGFSEEEKPLHLVRAIGEILLGLAGESPLVMSVDDAPFADHASLQCLLYLARRLTARNLVLVITEASPASYGYRHFHPELARQQNYHSIQLGMLSLKGVTEMLTKSLGSEVAYRIARPYYELTEGNPLLTRALIEDHPAPSSGEPAEIPIGDTFRRAISGCFYRCGPIVLEAATAIAILGENATPTILADYLELSLDAIEEIMGRLEQIGLVAGTTLRHHTANHALLQSLGFDDRASLRLRAASVLYAHGTDANSISRHLVAAQKADEQWAVDVLQDAAEQSLSEDDAHFALDCLRLAYRTCDNEARRLPIAAMLVRAGWRIEPSHVFQYLPELAKAALDGRLDYKITRRLFAYLLWRGDFDQALDILHMIQQRGWGSEETSGEADWVTDSMHTWLALAYASLSEGGNSAYRPQPRAAMPPITAGAPTESAPPLIFALQGREPDALTSAERILQKSQLTDDSTPAIVDSLLSLIYIDNLDKAAYWCDRMIDETTIQKTPTWKSLFLSVRAVIDIRLGKLAAAYQAAQTAVTSLSYKSWGAAIALPTSSLLLTAAGMKAHEDVACCLSLPEQDVAFQTIGGLHYLHARGHYYLATGRSLAALEDFQTCGKLMTQWGMDSPTIAPWRIDIAQGFLKTGRPGEARCLVNEQLARLMPAHVRIRGIALRVLAATSGAPSRISLLGESAEALQRSGNKFELSLTLAELAQAHRTLGNEDKAHALTSYAHRLAEACGVRSMKNGGALSPAAASASGTSNSAANGVSSAALSKSELRVAALAVVGLTNEQIASRLFITVSTVEQHLTHTYKKLNVKGRAALPIELRQMNVELNSTSLSSAGIY